MMLYCHMCCTSTISWCLSCCCPEECLSIYGGKFTSPNQERFNHFKDFWMLDLKTNKWEQLNFKGCPSPRSGHWMYRATGRGFVVHQIKFADYRLNLRSHFIKAQVIQVDSLDEGGKFTSPNQERFNHFKDFWMLDLKTNKWEQLNFKGCPSPRSGHWMQWTGQLP
ncbi:hypothetical protein ACET3Z_027416 [Daucus carota]